MKYSLQKCKNKNLFKRHKYPSPNSALSYNAKNLVFDICVKGIIYLLLYNLHDWTFKVWVGVGGRINQETIKFWCKYYHLI